ncbi:hypothetical protein [Gallionella capsiferriformans]|uniref:RiboL-PSP-HEPN domain-containing protein n=1 Tax=Gallionella capsiferriformans (strain ES-2) TaxID=395494 RepID=D9SH45_GALCS|nr:hypothetical protein [Gallionella capsiferriformans]ADL55842.1 hypothetical protein Galf_1832 [Gallionella capsiferriformans ES-2]
MEINVHFACTCGAFVEENIYVSEENLATDTTPCNSWKVLICDGCAKDYEAAIISTQNELDVSIDGAVSLEYEVVDNHEYDEISWTIESTQQLETYTKISRDVVLLLQLKIPDEAKNTLYNMLYAQVVTVVEAYLSGIFIHTVINSDDLIRKLVESDPELAKKQFSLNEIFSKWNELKFIVAKHLKDIIFHDLKKIKPMYFSVLEIDFGDIGWLFKAVLIRHDCVHRNGVDKEGNPTGIDESMIIDLIKNCASLVAAIDEQIQFRNLT